MFDSGLRQDTITQQQQPRTMDYKSIHSAQYTSKKSVYL